MDENKGFDFGAVMAKALGTEASEPGMLQIRYLPYDLLVPDPTNNYSLDDIEELAGNIETVGLLDPPVVRPIEDGKYMIVSGHRRHKAIGLILEAGESHLFDNGVPCIVSADGQNAEISGLFNELRLLMANADNRKMTSADLNQQAERVEAVVAKLDAAGFHFPGRRRDWVAKLTGMNKTKLGNLKVIREKLAPEIKKQYYDKGNMAEATALALARLPAEQQRDICRRYTQRGSRLEYMREWYVTEYVAHVKRLAGFKCPKEKSAACSHQAALLDRIYDGSNDYKPCEYKNCCADCDKLAKCKFVCPKMAAKAEKLKAKAKAEAAENRTKEKAQADADIREIEHIWFRFGQALAVNGMKDKTLRSQDGFNLYMSDERIAALEDYSCTDTSKNELLPFSCNFRLENFRRLRKMADLLGVSLDYLFLRSDQPEIGGRADEAADEELPPKPGEYVTEHGRQLSFDEIAARVGKVIVYDQSTQSKEVLKAVKVEKIIDGETQRRLVYFDGHKQRGYVNESYFDETLPHPCRVYELAPTGERIATAPEAPRNDRTWQTGEPTEAGYYAVKKQLFHTDFVSLDAFYWDDGWFNSHLPGASPIDEAYTILRWLPLPEDSGEEGEA